MATLHSLTAATTVPVSVDFQHAASPGAVVRAVHGVSMGPKVGHTWRRTQPNYNPNADDMDFVAGFNRTAVPAVSDRRFKSSAACPPSLDSHCGWSTRPPYIYPCTPPPPSGTASTTPTCAILKTSGLGIMINMVCIDTKTTVVTVTQHMPHPCPHPQVRVHGMGCIDMNVLWRPFPAYAGQDPANSSNYNWGIADQCMANVYADPNLPHLRAFVRFGHSRAMVADHPDFCQGPDDLNVFAAVCLAVLHRYRRAMGYQLSDVSVWNEPANEIEQSTSAFYCRDSTRCTDLVDNLGTHAVRPEPRTRNRHL